MKGVWTYQMSSLRLVCNFYSQVYLCSVLHLLIHFEQSLYPWNETTLL